MHKETAGGKPMEPYSIDLKLAVSFGLLQQLKEKLLKWIWMYSLH